MDHGAEEGGKDYMCGPFANVDHDGTDFAIRDLAEMKEGVAVLAAADGVVKFVHDGMQDIDVTELPEGTVDGRACGNGVVIYHSKGFLTTYCHMRQNSITVKPEENVTAGQKIGLVGMSGMATFPHIHFRVKYAGKLVDPFLGPKQIDGCGDTKSHLWTQQTFRSLQYKPLNILKLIVTRFRPDTKSARAGLYNNDQKVERTKSLYVWMDLSNPMVGDEIDVKMLDPDGRLIMNLSKFVDQDDIGESKEAVRQLDLLVKKQIPLALPFGRRIPWQPGTYNVEATISRMTDGRVVSDRATLTFEMPSSN